MLGTLAAEVLVYLSEQREQLLAWRAEGAPGRETDLVLAGLSLMGRGRSGPRNASVGRAQIIGGKR